jgi:hypothetical protein
MKALDLTSGSQSLKRSSELKNTPSDKTIMRKIEKLSHTSTGPQLQN